MYSIRTHHRQIVTPIPNAQSLATVERLRRFESRSTDSLAPIVWDRAEGYQVYDAHGNCWIDFTSGIYVANVGHSHPAIRDALHQQIDQKLLHAYMFPTDVRTRFVERLVQVTPPSLEKVFLLSTGSESIECAIKLCRLHGMSIDQNKTLIISSIGAFHGKTMGSQMLSSDPDSKKWIVNLDPDILHIPFPAETEGPEALNKHLGDLHERGVDLNRTAGFVLESYQGIGGPKFFHPSYMQALRRWSQAHQALLVFDEIQSGFGRTGKLFAYEHYGVEADLVCCGKGISSGLPLSAVIGRAQALDVPGAHSMSSTHTANPLCCAAGLATLEVLETENLISAAANKGPLFENGLNQIQRRHPDRIVRVLGRGMVHALFFVCPGTSEPDLDMAERVTDRAIQKGLMLFHTHGDFIKMGPPLVTPPDAIREGIEVLSEAVDECA